MTGVRSLTSINSEIDTYIGNKALNLAKIISCEPVAECVLPGFCVTFDIHKDIAKQLQEFEPDIRQKYWELLKSSPFPTVVVRSSADREDCDEALFPGVLRSFTGISSISSLRQAIIDCVYSAWSPVVKGYSEMKGVDDRFKFFTVLIQEELPAEYAGVVFSQIPLSYLSSDTMITQMANGNNHKLVKGIGQFNTYTLVCNHTQITYQCIEKAFIVEHSIERHILELLYKLTTRLKELFKKQLDVEWGYANGKLYIYQARFLVIGASHGGKPRRLSALDKNRDQGLKFQAMSFFAQHKLFQREVLLFLKETPVLEIRSVLLTRMENSPVTVRFSCENDIGLPRVFAGTPDEAADKIEALKEDAWSVIAYQSLNVKESYELYLDQKKTVLEYVPGIWESDSHLSADTIVLAENNLQLWLANENRTAKYEDFSGEWTETVCPMTKTQALNRFQALLPVLQKIRSFFNDDLPLNFHFVSDGEGIYFLNCRLSREVDWDFHIDQELYIVQEVSDCNGWDGRSAILFRPNLHRGEESIILKFVPFLKSVSVPIYVEFGILSHPAIMLRELGITVLPRFRSHDCYVIPNYSQSKEKENEN